MKERERLVSRLYQVWTRLFFLSAGSEDRRWQEALADLESVVQVLRGEGGRVDDKGGR